MNKTYKCFFCEHDRPVEKQNEICKKCTPITRDGCFKLKKRMSQFDKKEWEHHQKLDKFFKENKSDLSLTQIEFAHRRIEPPMYYSGGQPSRNRERDVALRWLFLDMIKSVKFDPVIKEDRS